MSGTVQATPPAPVTRLLLILCVGLQLLVTVLGPSFQQALFANAALIPGRLTGAVAIPAMVPPWATLATHQLLHGGWLHLLMNMVFLGWVGRQVEWAIGSGRLALLFLIGGIAGGLVQVLVDPASPVPVVGASGSIAAVFAAYALLFARGPEAPTRVLGLSLTAEMVRALRYASLWVGLQLLTAVAFNSGDGSGIGRIAIWSHIGGFVAGLAMALPMMKAFERPEG